MKEIVLDTNIIVHATVGDDPTMIPSCAKILFKVVDEDGFRIALDNGLEILDEYRNNIEGERSQHTRLIEELIEQEAYRRGDSNAFSHFFPINEKKVRELKENGFHTNDLIFVRTAPKTNTMSIITTDSESLLNEDHKRWIKEELDVNVYSPSECPKELLDV